MKSIVMIIGIVLCMGCALDQEMQEETIPQNKTLPKHEIQVEYIYIDCDGNEITDPDVIEEIKTSNSL